jgi:hypothetical protein
MGGFLFVFCNLGCISFASLHNILTSSSSFTPFFFFFLWAFFLHLSILLQ